MKNKNAVWQIAIGIIVVAIVVFVLLWIFKGGGRTIIPPKPLNPTVNLSAILGDMQDIIRGDTYNQITPEGEAVEGMEEMKKTPTALDETIMDFGEYSYLEKKAVVYTNDESINEVWLVKLTTYEEQEAVARLFGNRIMKLRNAFQENAEQMQIISDAVIKQEDGMVIAIISPNRQAIEKAIDNAM